MRKQEAAADIMVSSGGGHVNVRLLLVRFFVSCSEHVQSQGRGRHPILTRRKTRSRERRRASRATLYAVVSIIAHVV